MTNLWNTFSTSIKKINNTQLFWLVYIAFLFVLWPQSAWTINQLQDRSAVQIEIMGVSASPLAWALSGVVEATIAIVTHSLNEYWRQMPNRYKAADMQKKRFVYRWLNVYAVALFVSMIASSVANYTHVVEFTNSRLKVFSSYPGAVSAYQVLFGLALPCISFVFARVLSTMQEGEYETDPALDKAKADLKEANSTIKNLEQTIRKNDQEYSVRLADTERLLTESEQRYRAVGDVVLYLFGDELALTERIRGVRKSFPNLSQNGISQLLGCSVSTVNVALQGFAIEIPELIDAQ